jgi:hypothetical protein
MADWASWHSSTGTHDLASGTNVTVRLWLRE